MAAKEKVPTDSGTHLEELQIEKTLLLALSIFISTAVGYVLISLVGNIPGDAENARNWIIAALSIIGFTLFIILYTIEYFPPTRIWLKMGVIISSTMAFLNFSRFYRFYSEYIKATTEVEYNAVHWAYNSFLFFLALIGLFLILEGKKHHKGKENKWKIAFYCLAGAVIIIVSILSFFFISPTALPPSTGGFIE